MDTQRESRRSVNPILTYLWAGPFEISSVGVSSESKRPTLRATVFPSSWLQITVRNLRHAVSWSSREIGSLNISRAAQITVRVRAKQRAQWRKPRKLSKKCRASGSDAFLALLVHPNTPPDSVQVSPARRIFNRRTRSLLPMTTILFTPQAVSYNEMCRA